MGFDRQIDNGQRRDDTLEGRPTRHTLPNSISSVTHEVGWRPAEDAHGGPRNANTGEKVCGDARAQAGDVLISGCAFTLRVVSKKGCTI